MGFTCSANNKIFDLFETLNHSNSSVAEVFDTQDRVGKIPGLIMTEKSFSPRAAKKGGGKMSPLFQLNGNKDTNEAYMPLQTYILQSYPSPAVSKLQVRST